ncbi:hypothetical protein [Halomonas ramblicola]|uniref:hypothetical protein n=1 Tax=Halomonas ramblicola TaxID=747349 RepID=UPI0025B2F105|nr:hypothetical protein [Halomonas ramblicola]MDN3520017.1 hypothetical protein [Halomonas ramblicola]
MVIHDLRTPMMANSKVIETEENPITLLRSLNDRSRVVMLMYKPDLDPTSLVYCFMSFNPENGELGFAYGGDAQEAYELAQAQYQRETSPYGATTQ